VKAILHGGPADGREVETAGEVRNDLQVEGVRYVLEYVDDRRGVLHYRLWSPAGGGK
jgi:hypothetical protein